jgi:NTP pyrophosphatase (non-canonical NTP hydrolase)
MKNIELSLVSLLKAITNFTDELYRERNILKKAYESELGDFEGLLEESRNKFNEKFSNMISVCVEEVLECFQMAIDFLARYGCD